MVTRRWTAAQVKDGIADADVRRLGDLPPHRAASAAGARVVAQLRELGWRPQAAEGGFAAGQPQYVFQIPLAPTARRTEEDVLKGMNQLWRRNIKKADKEGVEVDASSADAPRTSRRSTTSTSTPPSATTSRRGRCAYFATMFDALGAEDPDRIRLWLARHEGDLVAATIAIRVGAHAWYSYGASSTEKRDVRGSNAVQWAMIRDALAAGADVYDLRGITDTLDADDSHVGLIQFKVGTGGEAVEYAGEWDLPLNRLLYKAFDALPGAALGADDEPHPDRRRRRAGAPTCAPSPTRHPGLVPVAKGNGYGFTLGRLARKAAVARASTPLAVGTYEELPEVATRFDGDLLVLTPWRPFVDPTSTPASPTRVIHTVSRLDDLDAAARPPAPTPGSCSSARTSMQRHGISARELWEAGEVLAPAPRRPGVEGVALHLPLAPGLAPRPRSSRLLTDVVAAGLPAAAHASGSATSPTTSSTTLRAAYARLRRSGPASAPTSGSATAARCSVTATVLDVHAVERGDVFGYRGRTAPKAGHLLVVSGGTAHGIGLEAPTGDAVDQAPRRHARPRRPGRGRLRAVAVLDRRQAAAVRRAAAHAGLDAVPARAAPACRPSATRSTCGCATPPPTFDRVVDRLSVRLGRPDRVVRAASSMSRTTMRDQVELARASGPRSPTQ